MIKEHVWVEWLKPLNGREDFKFCKVCGIVQRRDDKNKPCKGPIKLRKMEQPLDTTGRIENPS